MSTEFPFYERGNSILWAPDFHFMSTEFPFYEHRISILWGLKFYFMSTEFPFNERGISILWAQNFHFMSMVFPFYERGISIFGILEGLPSDSVATLCGLCCRLPYSDIIHFAYRSCASKDYECSRTNIQGQYLAFHKELSKTITSHKYYIQDYPKANTCHEAAPSGCKLSCMCERAYLYTCAVAVLLPNVTILMWLLNCSENSCTFCNDNILRDFSSMADLVCGINLFS